jgi:hypothetical protein
MAPSDPAYTAGQLGHEDPTFTLRVYTHAVKRRERLTGVEREQFDRALEWASWARDVPAMGTSAHSTGTGVAPTDNAEESNPAPRADFR